MDPARHGYATSISAKPNKTRGKFGTDPTDIHAGQRPYPGDRRQRQPYRYQFQRVSSALTPWGPQRDHTSFGNAVKRHKRSPYMQVRAGTRGFSPRAPNRPASLPKPCVAGSNPARAPSKIAGQRPSPSVKSADPSLRDRASSTRDSSTTAQGRAVARDGRLRRSASEPRAHQASRRLCAYRVRERVLKLVLGHRCSACGRTDDTVRNQRAVHRHHEVTDVVDRGLAVEGHRKDHA